VLSTFGQAGRQAGQFHVPHNIGVDSQDSLYITEVDTGRRVHRFRRMDQQGWRRRPLPLGVGPALDCCGPHQ
jgi:streptogramin lyase